jgi:glutathione reductase (NADPH)
MSFDFDLFVIGAGSGGVRAARMAGTYGAKVGIAESDRVGGTCVIRGCVPKKLLVYASHYAEDFEDAHGYGWTVLKPRFSWPTLIEHKNREISRQSGLYLEALERAGVTLLSGKAVLADAHTVVLDGRKISAAHILIATGARPVKPAIPGIEHAITSDDAFELPHLPPRVLIVGGGYIAVEFAGIFRGLGSEVTLSYRSGQILRGFDEDVRTHLHEEMVKKGIRILTHSVVSRLDWRHNGTIEARGVDDGAHAVFDAVLYATGRHPNTEGLGLAEAGVKVDDKGAIVVDSFSRSSVPSIFAVGDVTDRIALTPVAIREGAGVATTLFGGTPVAFDHLNVPSAVFSQPPVGTVGLSEHAAAAQFGAVDVYRKTFRSLRHTLSGRHEQSMMKLIVDPASQRVIGAHMVGADAPEIIQGVAIAVNAGLTKAQFDATVGIHPTAAEEFVTMRDKVAARPLAAEPRTATVTTA